MAIFQFFICTQFWHSPYLCRLHACPPTAPHGTGVLGTGVPGTGVPGTGVPGTGVLGNLDSGAGAGIRLLHGFQGFTQSRKPEESINKPQPPDHSGGFFDSFPKFLYNLCIICVPLGTLCTARYGGVAPRRIC